MLGSDKITWAAFTLGDNTQAVGKCINKNRTSFWLVRFDLFPFVKRYERMLAPAVHIRTGGDKWYTTLPMVHYQFTYILRM